jgi:hypothetical protein
MRGKELPEPSEMFRHYCPEEDGRQVIFSWRVCQKCGSRAEFHKWRGR